MGCVHPLSRGDIAVGKLALVEPRNAALGDEVDVGDRRIAIDHAQEDVGRRSSVIEGGVELSSYPACCKLGLERRTLPGESGRDIEAELAGVLERCRNADPEFEASHRTLLVREPFEIDTNDELVSLVARAAGEVMGEPAKIGGASYWADSAFTAAAGIPTVLFGPGGEGAHATEEWVSLADTDAVASTLVRLATRFCA